MTQERLPGLHPNRLVQLSQTAVDRCELDLRGLVVLTEAASGAYAVTPLIAALAGADRVLAKTADSRWGSARSVRDSAQQLLALAGVEARLEVRETLDPSLVASADIVTNSGHLRPLDRRLLSQLKPTAVVTLMYEAWELRAEDVDLVACRQQGIAVAGTDERHPSVDVFSYLGAMAQKLLFDAGVAVYGSRLLVLSDNPFAPFLEHGLTAAGAEVQVAETLPLDLGRPADAILVALSPQDRPVLSSAQLAAFAERFPGTPLVRFWGDLPAELPLPIWPPNRPGGALGHMGVLPSDLGPEPVVRLQAGGLKVGELLARARHAGHDPATAERLALASGRANLPLDTE